MIFSKSKYLIFLSLMILAIFISYFNFDRTISMFFIEHANIFKHLGKKASMLGESHWYLTIGVLGALYFAFIDKNRPYMHRFLFLIYVNIFSGLISLILKLLFGRLRPWKLENGENRFGFLSSQNPDYTFAENISYQIDMLMQNSTHYTSFPSGHTTTIFAVFTYMSILFPRFIYLWLSIALLGASSRILANDHFLSDVFAGIIVGTISTLFIYSKIKEKIDKNY